MKNNLAYICSPYRGNILEKARNILYARHLTKLALQLGYTPITTHLYLTQVLNDNIPMQRRQGLKAGRDILNACDTIINRRKAWDKRGNGSRDKRSSRKTSNYSYLGGTHEQIRPNTPHE